MFYRRCKCDPTDLDAHPMRPYSMNSKVKAGAGNGTLEARRFPMILSASVCRFYTDGPKSIPCLRRTRRKTYSACFRSAVHQRWRISGPRAHVDPVEIPTPWVPKTNFTGRTGRYTCGDRVYFCEYRYRSCDQVLRS